MPFSSISTMTEDNSTIISSLFDRKTQIDDDMYEECTVSGDEFEEITVSSDDLSYEEILLVPENAETTHLKTDPDDRSLFNKTLSTISEASNETASFDLELQIPRLHREVSGLSCLKDLFTLDGANTIPSMPKQAAEAPPLPKNSPKAVRDGYELRLQPLRRSVSGLSGFMSLDSSDESSDIVSLPEQQEEAHPEHQATSSGSKEQAVVLATTEGDTRSMSTPGFELRLRPMQRQMSGLTCMMSIDEIDGTMGNLPSEQEFEIILSTDADRKKRLSIIEESRGQEENNAGFELRLRPMQRQMSGLSCLMDLENTLEEKYDLASKIRASQKEEKPAKRRSRSSPKRLSSKSSSDGGPRRRSSKCKSDGTPKRRSSKSSSEDGSSKSSSKSPKRRSSKSSCEDTSSPKRSSTKSISDASNHSRKSKSKSTKGSTSSSESKAKKASSVESTTDTKPPSRRKSSSSKRRSSHKSVGTIETGSKTGEA